MHEVLLVRHGQTDWNVEKRIMGAHPVPLNEKGREQARQLAEFLSSHPLQGLHSSPHQRALQTAEMIASDRKIKILQDERLREIEHGKWVGKTFQEIRSLPDYVPYYLQPEKAMGGEGESLLQVQKRGVDFVETIRRQAAGRYVLVSHADWIKCVLLHYMGMPLTELSKFRIDNASISCLHFEKRHERVICINHGVDAERLFGAKEFL